MTRQQKIWDILEYILGIIAVILLFLYVFLNMSAELKDPDIWLHLKTGEYIVQHKTVPGQDIFSSTVSGKAWLDHSWLVQVIFYLVFRFGGADNLIFLSAITVTLAFLCLFLSAYKQRKDLALTVGVLLITILASRMRFNIRPENFSILFFSFYLFILTRHINKNYVFLLPLIQLIWVNCHGFFILGPIFVGAFILGEKLKRADLLPWQWEGIELLDRNSYQKLKYVFLLVCLACFINPYGYKGAFYPLWVAFTSTGKSSIFYKYIQELLPTWRYYKAVSSYYILILLSSLLFLLNFKRLNITYFMLWLISLCLSLPVNRNIIFFNFLAFLTITDILNKGLDVNKFNFIKRFFGNSIYLLKCAIVFLIILWALKSNNSLLMSRYYLFEEKRMKSSLLGIAKRYPKEAADFILKNDLADNLFNLFNHGSYLIYRLYPEKKVFIDGRTELYEDDFFKNYQKILALNKDGINKTFDRYNINTVLLTGGGSEIGNLASYFFSHSDWALVYFDEDSLIFLKDTLQNKMLINQLKIDLKKWEVEPVDLDSIGLRNVFPWPYIKRAWIFYFLGLDEQAMNEAKEALKILPTATDAYNIIAKIYIKQKLYAQAFENLRLARIYGPLNSETLATLGKYYMEKSRTADAIKAYKRFTKLSPYSAEGYYLLGHSYSKLNNIKLAIMSLRTAIKLNPFIAKYYKELRDLLYKGGNFKEAVKIYKNALDLGLDTKD